METASEANRTVDDLFKVYDILFKWMRKRVFEDLLNKCLELDCNKTTNEILCYYADFPINGQKFLEVRFHVRTQDELLKMMPSATAQIRALFMHIMIRMSGPSARGYLALERAIISDHERCKVEKRHRKGAKAKFQQMAIGQWVSLKRKESKRNFAIKFSLFLSSQHNIQLNPDTIAEDWLKGH